MRKKLWVALSMIVVILTISACGKANTEGEQKNQEDDLKERKETDVQDPEYVIKYAFTTPLESIQGQGAQDFADRVAEKTGGRIEVQLYPSAQLGDKIANMEGLRTGTVDMTDIAASDMSNFNQRWSVFSLPYVFETADEVRKVVHDEAVEEMLNADLEKAGFKVLAWWNMGGRSVMNTKCAIHIPEDAKGIKIRVMQDQVLAKAMEAMGFSAVSMGWSEVYTALQQGTIDAFENSAPLCYDNNMYEVAKYFSLTEQFRIPDPQLISLKFFESLPDDLQEALVEAGQENEEWQFAKFVEYEQECMEKLKEEGVNINEVDKTLFIEATKDISELYFESAPEDAPELYEAMRSATGK